MGLSTLCEALLGKPLDKSMQASASVAAHQLHCWLVRSSSAAHDWALSPVWHLAGAACRCPTGGGGRCQRRS